jgi:hypothetical protein
MFEHYPSTHRQQRPPTSVEQWALREAKSQTMAADLLLSRRDPALSRPWRRTRYTHALILIAASLFVAYWLR